jgi:hypothetical protein
MELYRGIDLHSTNSYTVVLDGGDGRCPCLDRDG